MKNETIYSTMSSVTSQLDFEYRFKSQYLENEGEYRNHYS